jgi:small subunit ribosomal protein S16
MIKIRMSRGGRKALPIYTIVAADTRSPRDGRFLEKLGQYNPNEKDEAKILSGVKTEAINKWVSNGAQLSDTVRTLFKRHNVKL